MNPCKYKKIKNGKKYCKLKDYEFKTENAEINICGNCDNKLRTQKNNQQETKLENSSLVKENSVKLQSNSSLVDKLIKRKKRRKKSWWW